METTLPPESKPLPPPQQAEQPCPRCNSPNTKFCYYNNYSLSQPRYFCKSCRRYWTKGGTLRNVPVGGGCRRRPRSTSRRSDTQFSAVSDVPNPNFTSLVNLGFEHFAGGPRKLAGVESAGLETLNPKSASRRADAQFSAVSDTPDSNFMSLVNLGFDHFAGGNQKLAGLETFGRFQNNGFFEAPSGFGSYLGNGGGGGGGAGGYAAEMAVGAFSNVEKEGRVLWGFPWQVNSDHGVGTGSDRGSWADINPAAWHGLLNNSLL